MIVAYFILAFLRVGKYEVSDFKNFIEFFSTHAFIIQMFLKNPLATFGGAFPCRFMFRKFYLGWSTVKNKMLNTLIAQRVDAKALD